MIVELTDIDWDSDEELPKNITIIAKDNSSIEDVIDGLSDEYGYCINNFSFEIKETTWIKMI